MCLPIVIMKHLLDFYLPGNPICIKEGVSKQYTTLQECETNFVQGINFFFFCGKKVSPVNRYTSHSHARSPAEVGPGKRVTT